MDALDHHETCSEQQLRRVKTTGEINLRDDMLDMYEESRTRRSTLVTFPNTPASTVRSYTSGCLRPSIASNTRTRKNSGDSTAQDHIWDQVGSAGLHTISEGATTPDKIQQDKKSPDEDIHCNSCSSCHQATASPARLKRTISLEQESQQKTYLLKVCNALMSYGAPTHRLERYVSLTAEFLGMTAQSFYLPGCMLVSFNGALWRSTELRIIRTTPTLNLTKLQEAHTVYKNVIHEKTSVREALDLLEKITTGRNEYHRWCRILMYGLGCACIGPVSYGARPLDLPIIFVLGCLVGFLELALASTLELYGNVFEVSAAILTFALGRCFGSIQINGTRPFCFSAIAQSSLVMILPGFTITMSALELQSKNIVSGSVRLVFGIIYMCFLAFGSTIGATMYGAIDANAVSSDTCATASPFWWQIIFVAPFTLCFIIVNQGKWTKSPITILITLAGWVVIHFFGERFPEYTPISQAVGAFTVGVLANLYSRLGHGLAVAVLHPAVFMQVPGSFAASGSLVSGVTNANRLTGHNVDGFGVANQTTAASDYHFNPALLSAGYSMVEIAIAITVGLSLSTLIVYPRRSTNRGSGFFTF